MIDDLHPRQRRGTPAEKGVPERGDVLTKQILRCTLANECGVLTIAVNKPAVLRAKPVFRVTWLKNARLPLFEVTWPVEWQ